VTPRWYISGPMSGLPDHNRAAFAECAHWLRQAGHEHVISPHEIAVVGCCFPADPADGKHDWDAHMREDIAALMTCDHIVLLPGWPASRGSRLELTIAMELGFKVLFYDADGVEHLTEMSR